VRGERRVTGFWGPPADDVMCTPLALEEAKMLREWTGLTLMTLLLCGAAVVAAQEQPKKEMQPPVSDSAATGKAAGEETKPPEQNSEAAPVETRSGPYSCDVYVNNNTRWVIHRVYIDGRHWGSVGRHGSLTVYNIGSGRTKIYAEADFNDGPTRYWGPRWFDCNSHSTYTWNLN
jgi:hypothetical protein